MSRYSSVAFEPGMTSPSIIISFLSLMDTRLVFLSKLAKRLALSTNFCDRVSSTMSGELRALVTAVVSPYCGCSIFRNLDCLDA